MPNLEIAIRRAAPSDTESIAQLYAELVSNPAVAVLPERIDQISKDANTALLVCEYRGIVCGTALVSLCADVMFRSQPFAVVENFVISSSARRQGLGTLLLRHIEAFCLANDCSKIILLSSVERERAHHFFECAGFTGSSKRGFIKYRRSFEATTSKQLRGSPSASFS